MQKKERENTQTVDTGSGNMFTSRVTEGVSRLFRNVKRVDQLDKAEFMACVAYCAVVLFLLGLVLLGKVNTLIDNIIELLAIISTVLYETKLV